MHPMPRLSPVTIAVLALLAEAPMHPYRMQQLIKERGVDLVVNVRNRTGLHAAIERLARDDQIAVHAIERDAGRPERTLYRLTPHGRQALITGLRDSVAGPTEEFPLFPAVVSFLHLLTPDDARRQLQRRAAALKQRLDRAQAVLTASIEYGVPRVYLLEHEHTRALITAELDWVRTITGDLSVGTLTWEPTATNQTTYDR
jgi:DNA-binding PadR family transcriptional regulator